MESGGLKVFIVLYLFCPTIIELKSSSSSQESKTLEKSSKKGSLEENPTEAPRKQNDAKAKRVKNKAKPTELDITPYQQIESDDSKFQKAVKFKKLLARADESDDETSGVVKKRNKMKRKKKKGGEKYEKMKKEAAREKAKALKSALTPHPTATHNTNVEDAEPKHREKRKSSPESDESRREKRNRPKSSKHDSKHKVSEKKDDDRTNRAAKGPKIEVGKLKDKRKTEKSSSQEILTEKSFEDQSKYEIPSEEYGESSEQSPEEPLAVTGKTPNWSEYIEDYSEERSEASEKSFTAKSGKAFKKVIAKHETDEYESGEDSSEEKNKKTKKFRKYKSHDSSKRSKEEHKMKSKNIKTYTKKRHGKIRGKSSKSSESKRSSEERGRAKHSSEEYDKAKHSSEEHGSEKSSSEENYRAKHSSKERVKAKHSSEEHDKAKHTSEEYVKAKRISKERAQAKPTSKKDHKEKQSFEEHDSEKHSSEEHEKAKHTFEEHGSGKHSLEEQGKARHSSEEQVKAKHSSEEHNKAKQSSEEHGRGKHSSEEGSKEQRRQQLTTRPRRVRKFKIELPPGRNKTQTLLGTRSFYDLVTKSDTFVDKTELITDILCDEKILHFTRPRKWGRSMTIDMLKRFFEMELDDYGNHLFESEKINKKLFRGGIKMDLMPELDKISTPRLRRKKKKLAAIDAMRYKISPALKISEDSKAMMHLGKYPVMVFKFKNLKGDSYEQIVLAMKNLIFLQFKRFAWLLKRKIGYANKKMYKEYLKMSMSDSQFIKTGIGFITKMVHKIFKKRVVFFIDDEDYPVLQYMKNHYFDTEGLEKIHSMTKEFITKLGEDPNIHQGIIFGTMHIKQTTGILPEYYMPYSVNDPSYNTLLGFTDEEVDRLLTNKTGVSVSRRDLKKWYSGYNMGGKEMYNPWCVLNCIHNGGRIEPYFTQMSYTRTLRKGIPRDVITKLVHDEGVGVAYLHQLADFSYIRTYQAFIKSLMHSGYLTNFRNKLYIPNKEIYNFFSNSTYFKRINQTKSAEELEIMHKKDGI